MGVSSAEITQAAHCRQQIPTSPHQLCWCNAPPESRKAGFVLHAQHSTVWSVLQPDSTALSAVKNTLRRSHAVVPRRAKFDCFMNNAMYFFCFSLVFFFFFFGSNQPEAWIQRHKPAIRLCISIGSAQGHQGQPGNKTNTRASTRSIQRGCWWARSQWK